MDRSLGIIMAPKKEDKAPLKGNPDPFSGVTVDLANYSDMDLDSFRTALAKSLTEWKAAGKRGIWLKFPLEAAGLVPAAVDEGFVNHHAKTDYTMMCTWLDESMPNQLPNYAGHQIGAMQS